MRPVPQKERFVVFDLMRGYFVFGIVVNHLALFPNLIALFTGASKLWVSLAEGFFMVSGFFVGYLYKDKIKVGLKDVFTKLSLRSLRLYLWTVYLSLLFTYWGNMMPRGLVKESLWIVRWDNVFELLLKVFTFQYTYGWADILPIYVVFLLVSPFYLWFLSKGKWFYLFALNLFIWIFRGRSIYLAIQPIFFGGMILGYYAEKIRIFWSSVSIDKKHKFKVILYGTFILTLIASVISVFFFNQIVAGSSISSFLIAKNRVLNYYFDKQTVGLGRLVLAPIWIVTSMFLFSKFEKFIVRHLGWLFLTFGKNSLYAYILHAFVIYPVPFFVYYFKIQSIWWNTVISVICVFLIYFLLNLSSHAFKKRF